MARITAAGRRAARGFTILWALMTVALMGIYLAQAGRMWSTEIRRAKEEDLLRKGDAIRKAIQSYVRADSSGTYPKSFAELLSDPRVSFARRHLREAYPDPMANGEWHLILGPGGELYGVYSNAEGVPLKQDGFPDEYASFSLQKSYQEWKFVYYPSGGLMRR